MVSTRSTPSKPARPITSDAYADPKPGAAVPLPQAQRGTENNASSPSGDAAPAPAPVLSRAEQTTKNINSQIASAIPSKLPVSAADIPTLPTLDDSASTLKTLRSHLVLTVLVCGVVGLGWVVGFDLLQVEGHQSWQELLAVLAGTAVVFLGVLHWVGVAQIDFWAMITSYWWMSVPIAVAGLGLVTMMQEQETDLNEVQ